MASSRWNPTTGFISQPTFTHSDLILTNDLKRKREQRRNRENEKDIKRDCKSLNFARTKRSQKCNYSWFYNYLGINLSKVMTKFALIEFEVSLKPTYFLTATWWNLSLSFLNSLIPNFCMGWENLSDILNKDLLRKKKSHQTTQTLSLTNSSTRAILAVDYMFRSLTVSTNYKYIGAYTTT